MILYYVYDKLITCKYKHKIKGGMWSDDEHLFGIHKITISNNRNEKD